LEVALVGAWLPWFFSCHVEQLFLWCAEQFAVEEMFWCMLFWGDS